MRVWLVGFALVCACSQPPLVGPVDAQVPEAAPYPDATTSFDGAGSPETFDADAPDVDTCVALTRASGSPGQTCLARESLGACALLCDAGALYSCSPGDLPADAGDCVEVDAGDVTAPGTSSLCCGYSTCVRYAPADPTCNINTSGHAAWSCPNDDAGAEGPGPGATSTGDGPTTDTVIWCL